MQTQSKHTKIKEIFNSIQGEGLYLGQLHTFIRFCFCNLNCKYCDTDFDPKNTMEYSSQKLFNAIKDLKSDFISLTGGEPLLEADFLKEFFENYKIKIPFYLETNGTLYNELNKIIDYISAISMDIKLESATGQKNRFQDNKNFLEIANKKEVFVKIVFDKNISDDEIENCIKLAEKHNNTIILQPKMPIDKDFNFMEIFDKFHKSYKNTRLIPQVHKFLNVQ